MAQSTDSKTQSNDSNPAAQVWLKPEQIEEMRNATVAESADYLASRNDALLAVLADTGLRVAEAVALDTEMLDLSEGIIMLPPQIQKDYPNDNTPEYVEIELSSDTIRTLTQYLNTRWKDSPALFPSRQSERMTKQSVRNVVSSAAESIQVRPYTTGGRGEPSNITPHTLRHSVAYRMLNREEGNTLYDVTKRLRHATIVTTERVYSHFDRV